ncbi:MAG TPA: hypothetical protein VNX86_13140 [Rhizomicrobium sp.]|jgi:hypothetical protein|nr:hypothetical protein [Rhizomicrobium sp.]
MSSFISEEELDTFDGWLRYQGVEKSTLSAEQLEMWRGLFDEGKQASLAAPKARMKLGQVPEREYRYAVAIRNERGLWLTLWVRRSPRGEVFVLIPRGDRKWNPHASYHLKGRLHHKSYDMVHLPIPMRQPLNGEFRGAEHMGIFAGHGTRGGMECNPAEWSGMVEVPDGVLGPVHGGVSVDLVEPNCEPMDQGREIVLRQEFKDSVPWIVVSVMR